MPFNYDYGCDYEYELDADETYDALAEEQYLAEMEGAFGPYVREQDQFFNPDMPF